PVTPMDESDLRAHLAKQTSRTCALVDVLDLSAPRAELDRRFAGRLAGRPGIVLFDTLREDHLPAIGRLVWEAAEAAPPVFVAGSSGVEYALAAHWRSEGRFEEPGEMTCGAADALVVVSGSCSPVTAQQIDYATRHGFHEIALDTEALVAPTTRDAAESRYADEASDAVARGESVTLHTARGPDDPRVEATRRLVGAPAAAAATLGGSLGRILSAILSQTRVPRAVVTGGDSSYHAARALGIRSLETVAPIQPGSPMCRVHADNAAVDGVEMLFKGGQVGRPDIFIHALRGSAP
ncbi:four-carbon acid sugar kinase family protein, partial [Candidatus Poribacteria bacterium]|nr:four-carbon acid sugar kinase family protein [Candidatus Poribacteria bacterium]